MSKKIAVIDGNSLMHRAYHAIQNPMMAPDGTPTNAVFGFMSMLLKFIEQSQPDAVVCAFDAGKPQFRIEEMEQYKAQRPPMDEELHVQFPVVQKLLEAMNVPVVKVQGWEGDDILGTIAARDEKLGYRTLLLTGDKDACQLASDLTSIVTTKKGVSDIVIYGPAEVEEHYGVTPAQFPDFLGLMGDTADNIPGVPGVGKKRAAELLERFGTMEGVYANLDALKGKLLENVRDNEKLAYLSRRIATIVTDLDFELDLESISFPDFDAQKVIGAFQEYALSSALSRLLNLAGLQESGAPAKPAIELSVGERLASAEAKERLEEAIAHHERVGVVLEELDDGSLFTTFIGAFSMEGAVAVLYDDEAREAFARVVRDGSFVALDTKEAYHHLYPNDTTLPAEISLQEMRDADSFDLGLAAYVLESSASTYTYEQLAEVYLGGELPAAEEGEELAVMHASAARALVEPLTKAMEEHGVKRVYDEIDLPLVAVLCAMERTGAAIDVEHLGELGKVAQDRLDELTGKIYTLVGEEFNIDSPKQLAHELFEVMHLTPTKKNQRGYSTDASVLKELAKVSEVPALVLRYRELSKIKTTYIDALPRLRAFDGRLHTQFNETVTITGRLSSSEPNLQNIPVRTEFGRRIRECFVPLHDDWLFMSADYSQIELRLLAHLSQDEAMIAAFNSGEDFHANTASRVFGVPLDEMTPALRTRAKAVNFGIVYGQQSFGLAQSLDIPRKEAQEIIDLYFAAYPGVRRYLDDVVEQAGETGYAETMFGRRRYIPDLKAKNARQRHFGERTAMNHPMQGSAADIIKIAMNRVADRMLAEGFEARLMIQVHDELDFSVPKKEVEPLSALVREVMENVCELSVPLLVDVSTGVNWAEAH